MSLDTTIGPCQKPDGEVKDWEKSNQPSTHKHLDHQTGSWLKQYLDIVPSHPLPELLANTTGILWVMDCDGGIFFALEEVYRADDMSMAFVFPRKHLKLPVGLIKLGHPSLLPPNSAKHARCGGDIVYDPSLGREYPWIITFNSGRYGFRDHLQLPQLQVVAGLFAQNNVLLSPYVIG